jgi:hypothetical protein
MSDRIYDGQTLGVWPEPDDWRQPYPLVTMSNLHVNGVRQYCGVGCYGEAAKAGRQVRIKLDICPHPICSLCERRTREGLRHYIPSNGTEFSIFEYRCSKCRHYSTHADGYGICDWKILDQISESAWESPDSLKTWFDPANLDTETCPATCKKFTNRGDFGGEFRDPPPPDTAGQLTFADLTVVRQFPKGVLSNA